MIIKDIIIKDIIKEAQKEADQILIYCLDKYKLEPIKLRVKQIHRGHAYFDSKFISIPIWSYTKGLNYFYAYILHEISHFINYKQGGYGHGLNFKKIEKLLLNDFDLVPVYKKAYIKALKNNQGQTLFTKEA